MAIKKIYIFSIMFIIMLITPRGWSAEISKELKTSRVNTTSTPIVTTPSTISLRTTSTLEHPLNGTLWYATSYQCFGFYDGLLYDYYDSSDGEWGSPLESYWPLFTEVGNIIYFTYIMPLAFYSGAANVETGILLMSSWVFWPFSKTPFFLGFSYPPMRLISSEWTPDIPPPEY